MIKSKENEIKKCATNPFIEKTVEAVHKHTVQQKKYVVGNKNSRAVIVNEGTGEAVGGTSLFAFTEVDNDQFAKVFVNNISKWAGMSKSTASLFEYILYILEKEDESVYLYKPSFDEFLEDRDGKAVSMATYYRARDWLMKNEFIAQSVRSGWYYINPTLFFNGSRLSLVQVWETEEASKERVQKHKEMIKKQEQLALEFTEKKPSEVDKPSSDFD